MIDITKEIITEKGLRVIDLQYIPCNSCGNQVTYPIKGSIVVSEKPFKTEFCIWTEDGECDKVFKSNKNKNIKEK